MWDIVKDLNFNEGVTDYSDIWSVSLSVLVIYLCQALLTSARARTNPEWIDEPLFKHPQSKIIFTRKRNLNFKIMLHIRTFFKSVISDSVIT